MKKAYLILSCIAAMAIAGCRKEPNYYPPPPPVPYPQTDSFLSQDIYKINNYKSSGKGFILVSPYEFSATNKGRVMIFNSKGQLLKEKETDGATFCFRRWDINGKIRYTYIVNDVNTTHIPNLNQLTGYVVIADENLNEIKRVHLKSHGDIVAGAGYVDLDVHDFILLSDNHYYTMSYYPKRVVNVPTQLNPASTVTVVAPIIQEIKNDQVQWQWDGTDHPEFYQVSREGNDYTNPTVAQDYMHINSMVIDPKDNNLMCSFRHTDQILKINSQTGAVIWRLGGTNSDFPLTNNQKFYRQHDATFIAPNTILLFDNGEQSTRPTSRIVELTINEASKTVTNFKAFNIPAPFAKYMGSVQKIGENYFIGGGTGNYVLEINPNTGERFIEFISDRPTYRAYRY